MSRKEEILSLVPEDSVDLVESIIDDVVFLEMQLDKLRALPFIQIHPSDPSKQRSTPAAKMYKEFLQQYVNCIKMIEYVIYKDKRLEGDAEEESPLRKWFKANAGK